MQSSSLHSSAYNLSTSACHETKRKISWEKKKEKEEEEETTRSWRIVV